MTLNGVDEGLVLTPSNLLHRIGNALESLVICSVLCRTRHLHTMAKALRSKRNRKHVPVLH